MTWGAVAGAAVGVVGAALSSDAAGEASEGQQAASMEANRLQRDMYNQNVALAAPALNTGNSARDRLSFLLGLSGTGFSGSGAQGGGGSNRLNTYEELRAQLVPKFTQQPTTGTQPIDFASLSPQEQYARTLAGDQAPGASGAFQGAGVGPGYWGNDVGATGQREWVPGGQNTGPGATLDEAGLDAAIRAQMAEQEQAAAAREAAARSNPDFGRLAQGFEFGSYTPDKFSYTGEDLYKDPSYQFRLEQGQKAIDRQGAASGRFLSGGQLQASSNYNQGAASQEFQAAYGRAANTFNTNEGNRFGAFQANEGNRYNAYQTNFTNTVNPLLALSGAGQLAGTQLMNTNANYASTVGNNLMGAANASGAAGIAGANAINQGLSSGVNAYQTNQLINRFGGGVNNNPSISAGNQASFDSLGNSNNWWGTGG